MAALSGAFVLAGLLVTIPAAPAVAATDVLSVKVISARTEPRAFGGDGVLKGAPVNQFKFIINEDNTGTTEQRSPTGGCASTAANYPTSCHWPSITEVPEPSPIYASGDQGDLPMSLPDGRYLISVLADGYKIDGAHFSVPLPGSGQVAVELQPNPLPDSTLRGQVFSDSAPTDGTQDANEPGLANFVGHIADNLGEVQTDVYGNPLCTRYVGENLVTHEIPLGSLDADMLPVPIDGSGGNCLSDATGLLTIPHLGTNRYAFSATPPDGQAWIQTTTLEGNHDFDAWVMEGSTGYDTEFTVAGEPVPQPVFGFVRATNTLSGGSAHIHGVIVGINTYTPPKGGSFDFWGGNTGTKIDHPIDRPWLSLADVEAGDAAVWVGRGNANGTFDIPGVPDGNYTLSWWDEPQDYNLNFINVTVSGGQAVDMGTLPLNGWWTTYEGYVFNDLNRNGVKNAGEPGMPNFTLTMRRQDNTLMDRGTNTVTTDSTGHYFFESAYPLGAWTVMENYNDSFYTTGVTYQADNQPTPTTVKGAGVDVSVLSIIGLGGTMDWGVHAYSPAGNGIDPRNGGIVGTVSYGTTRNELDPRYLAAEDWQPGVANVPVELYAPIACGTTNVSKAATLQTGVEGDNTGLTWTADAAGPAGNDITVEIVDPATPDSPLSVSVNGTAITVTLGTGSDAAITTTASQLKAAVNASPGAAALVDVTDTGASDGSGLVVAAAAANLAGGVSTVTPCDPTESYELAPDGSYAQGKLLNTYVTEHWSRPTGCVARDVDGNPLVHGVDEDVLVPDQGTTGECISSFMQGVQFGPYPTDQGTPDANFGAAVDGNYGFGDGCFDGTLHAEDPSAPTCDGGDFEPLPAGDYLVHVAIPDDATGDPMYKVTGEEDINIGNGDQIIPQVPPPACAGALRTIDLAGDGTDGYAAVVGDGGVSNDVPVGVTVPESTPVDNTTFLDIGGSPYEGTQRPGCETKLVSLNNGKSIVPVFEVFTDVPLPSRLSGLIVDDINFSTDPRSTMYGEKAGVPFAPVGIYDFANRLVYTLESDFNGVYEVLLPSTNHISCPTPSGVCANMYRFVANDPGVPGALNPNWNPRYRTIATEFEAMPGVQIPTDLAPTQVGLTIESPATGLPQAVSCALDSATPQLMRVSQPYVNGSGSFTITGLGFGASPGQVTLDDTIVLPTTSWNDQSIAVDVPSVTPAGPHQLKITASNGQSTVNGLTFHVLRNSYAPFPAGAVLDYFNRSTVNTSQTLGSNWGGAASLLSALYRVTPLTPAPEANQAQVRGLGGSVFWSAGQVLGANQDAYLTFTKTVPSTGNRQGGVLLKLGTSGIGTINSFISVTYNATAGTVIVSTATTAGQVLSPVTRATISGAAFANGDTLGARALDDGTVNVYKNGALIGTTNVSAFGFGGGGRIGVRFAGTFTSTNDVRFDNFGGGNVAVASGGYRPNVYEVGPGRTYSRIQAALNAAYASSGNDLVVVYPGQPDLANPRNNPRGAYYENLIVASPVKLQGVGPGGFQGNTFVPGSIIDGSAFGGDTDLATAWYDLVGSLTWDGNQAVNDGEVIYLLASQNATTANGAARQFTSSFKAGIDGFDIRGGDQQGFPGNINDLTGGPTGLPPNIVTQGGAIMANAYVRNLQITNNVVQNNGGGYGTIRFGTPDLAAPDTNQHNEDARIANNRIISNAGTNLAGGIGLFAGSDRYEVARNDICGNFSLEYGGGLSVYGSSPNGKIHHNRMYLNMSNDEGGGIMIAGQLPATPTGLSPGSGPVDIYANRIQANLANDDGGGIRFLMAGNFPMNVYDNLVVNNVSTHEGGGIALDDAPNVRVYNNTIMKNLTTATAVTSNGDPMPAGLSTTGNSDQLQATLPGGLAGCGQGTNAPCFSNPLLFNNIFWDNRAGTRAGTTVTGLGISGGSIDRWDLGVANGAPSELLAPTNSVVQQSSGTHPYTTSGTNSTSDPAIASTWDVSVSFATWRQNPAFVDATLVTLEAPPNLMGDYHLSGCPASPACNLGAASKAAPTYQQPPATVPAPGFDIDDQVRPALGGFDSGADEVGGAPLPPPPPPPAPSTTSLYFSTAGNTNPPGAGGMADDADIYLGTGDPFIRDIDASAAPYSLPSSGTGNANVDGFDRLDANHFYLSFAGNVSVPGIAGTVADEDVVYFNAGVWSLYFDGSANGVNGTDLDAISVVGGQLYFSTDNSSLPSGVTGIGDDADIYRWNGGSSYTRVVDASSIPNPLPTAANVDGFVRVDDTHFYMSFSSDTTIQLPGPDLSVQDEDVVFYNAGTWSVYFDGTANGLGTSANLDVDAFDVA